MKTKYLPGFSCSCILKIQIKNSIKVTNIGAKHNLKAHWEIYFKWLQTVGWKEEGFSLDLSLHRLDVYLGMSQLYMLY